MKEFDVVVIGAGPAGYVAAIKAAQLGKTVACIDSREKLGGTCLNVGCIPSKALLSSSHKYYEAMSQFASHGIECHGIKFSLAKMQERKEKIVANLSKGIASLFRKNKIEHIKGVASFIDSHSVKVRCNDERSEIIKASYFVIATGSEPACLPNTSFDGKFIISSEEALALECVPKKMVILGAGVIGLEMGSVWSRLGAQVTVVEYADRILPSYDVDVSVEMRKILEKQGLTFMLQTKLIKAVASSEQVQLDLEVSDKKIKLEGDMLLVAIGRKPYTQNLSLENIGLSLNHQSRISVNNLYQTDVSNIFAVGDVIAGPMLAHKASEEGISVAEIICGQRPSVNYGTIPSVVYTSPEVAVVGQTEAEVKAANIQYKVGKSFFLANSRAKTNDETDGFVKIIVDQHDTILGAHIIGSGAGELIGEICVAMEFKAAAEDLARTSHAHPGYSEAIKEAALAAFSKPIHA